MVKEWGSIICQIAPGASHAVTLEQRHDATNTLTIEPSAFMLHEMHKCLISHHIQVGTFEGLYPFFQQHSQSSDASQPDFVAGTLVFIAIYLDSLKNRNRAGIQI